MNTSHLADSPLDLAKAVELASRLDRSKCRVSVKERFSKEIMVQKHLDFYGQVLARFDDRVGKGRRRAFEAP